MSSLLYEYRLRKPPSWLTYVLVVAFCASLVPLSLIARARFNTSDEPRIHLVQDMGHTPRRGAQQPSKVFADGRAARPAIEGTISRTTVLGDDHYTLGYSRDDAGKVTFFEGFPLRITVDQKLIERGQQRFNIYCSTCHGVDGRGMGIVHQRATQLQNNSEVSMGTSWVPPTNLHSDQARGRVEGHIYNTINNGIRNMGGLGAQIPTDDRWAIVAYVRALQLSDNFPASKLPPEVRQNLK
jgi:mono/diheme cytochrome c family protein